MTVTRSSTSLKRTWSQCSNPAKEAQDTILEVENDVENNAAEALIVEPHQPSRKRTVSSHNEAHTTCRTSPSINATPVKKNSRSKQRQSKQKSLRKTRSSGGKSSVSHNNNRKSQTNDNHPVNQESATQAAIQEYAQQQQQQQHSQSVHYSPTMPSLYGLRVDSTLQQPLVQPAFQIEMQQLQLPPQPLPIPSDTLPFPQSKQNSPNHRAAAAVAAANNIVNAPLTHTARIYDPMVQQVAPLMMQSAVLYPTPAAFMPQQYVITSPHKSTQQQSTQQQQHIRPQMNHAMPQQATPICVANQHHQQQQQQQQQNYNQFLQQQMVQQQQQMQMQQQMNYHQNMQQQQQQVASSPLASFQHNAYQQFNHPQQQQPPLASPTRQNPNQQQQQQHYVLQSPPPQMLQLPQMLLSPQQQQQMQQQYFAQHAMIQQSMLAQQQALQAQLGPSAVPSQFNSPVMNVSQAWTHASVQYSYSEAELQMILACLSDLTIFSKLTEHDKLRLAKSLTVQQYPLGTVIIHEGEIGNDMFLIKHGSVTIHKQGAFIMNMGAGAYFGELAFLNHSVRAATVVATAAPYTTCFILNMHEFDRLIGSDKLNTVTMHKRQGVSAEPMQSSLSSSTNGQQRNGSSATHNSQQSNIVPRSSQESQQQQMTHNGVIAIKSSPKPTFNSILNKAALASAASPATKAANAVSSSRTKAFRPSKHQPPPNAIFDKTLAVQEQCLAVMSQNLLFQKLNRDERLSLVSQMWLKNVKAGQVVIAQGEIEADFWYIVSSGQFDIFVRQPDHPMRKQASIIGGDGSTTNNASMNPQSSNRNSPLMSSNGTTTRISNEYTHRQDHPEWGTRVCQRAAGESFGELSLLYGAPRAATVVATCDSQLWSLDRWTFRNALHRHNTLELSQTRQFLAQIPHFARLLDRELQTIAEAMEEVNFDAGFTIVQEGAVGDSFFIVKSGRVVCTRQGKQVAEYSAGEYFGERAILNSGSGSGGAGTQSQPKQDSFDHCEPPMSPTAPQRSSTQTRAATVTTVVPTTCLYLHREAFLQLFGDLTPIFQQREQTYATLAASRAPSPLAKPSSAADHANGTASSGAAAGGVASTSTNKKPTGASVAAAEAAASGASAAEVAAVAARLDANSVRSALSAAQPAQAKSKSNAALPELSTSILFDDLHMIGTLGKGSFGVVKLVRHRPSGEVYALKCINKAQIMAQGQQEHVLSEKRCMQMLNGHPFLVQLIATYNHRETLYFLLQVCLGGELFSVLRKNVLFQESTARFYAAGVVLALEHMHSKGMIYRDLKPENLILDNDGYLKVTDFGFAKRLGENGRTWTLCGTPDYLAPEVVSGAGHGKGVDWWTLGILIYEMLSSYPPFYDEDHMRTYNKIMVGKVHYGSHLSPQAIDLISKLLADKPSKRLGVIAGGATLIKQHPWFKGFDWAAFEAKQMVAPIPVVNKLAGLSHDDKSMLSNFDPQQDDKKQFPLYVPDPKKPDWDKHF